MTKKGNIMNKSTSESLLKLHKPAASVKIATLKGDQEKVQG